MGIIMHHCPTLACLYFRDVCSRAWDVLFPCRKQAELEEVLIGEEVARRVKEQIEERVRAAMSSDAVQQSLQMRLEAERKVLEEQVRTVSTSVDQSHLFHTPGADEMSDSHRQSHHIHACTNGHGDMHTGIVSSMFASLHDLTSALCKCQTYWFLAFWGRGSAGWIAVLVKCACINCCTRLC